MPHQTAQRLAPPRHRATLLRYLRRQARLAVLQQIAYPLAGDPLVPREGGARPVECREQSGARLANPRGLLGRAIRVPAAVGPVADPPDDLAAGATPASRLFGKVRAARGLEGLARPLRRFQNGERVGRAGLTHARDEAHQGKEAHGHTPTGKYRPPERPASLTPGV